MGDIFNEIKALIASAHIDTYEDAEYSVHYELHDFFVGPDFDFDVDTSTFKVDFSQSLNQLSFFIRNEEQIANDAVSDYKNYIRGKYGHHSDSFDQYLENRRAGYKDLSEYLLGNISDIDEFDYKDANLYGSVYYRCETCGFATTEERAKQYDFKCPRCGGNLVKVETTFDEDRDLLFSKGFFGYNVTVDMVQLSTFLDKLEELSGLKDELNNMFQEVFSFNWTKTILEDLSDMLDRFLDVIIVDPIYLMCCFIDNALYLYGKDTGKKIKSSLNIVINFLEVLSLSIGGRRLNLLFNLGIDVKSVLYKIIYYLFGFVSLSVWKNILLNWLRNQYSKLYDQLKSSRESRNLAERTLARCFQWDAFLNFVFHKVEGWINSVFAFLSRYKNILLKSLLDFSADISANLRDVLRFHILKQYENIFDRLLRFGYLAEICLNVDDLFDDEKLNEAAPLPYTKWKSRYQRLNNAQVDEGTFVDPADMALGYVVDKTILPSGSEKYFNSVIWYDKDRVDISNIENISTDAILLTLEDILEMKRWKR